MTKRVMVLGCGQVGTYAVRALVGMGAEVAAADVKPAPGYFRRFSQALDVELHVGDICDGAALTELFKAHRTEVVVVTAGPVGRAVTRDPENAWKTHTVGAEVATECASRMGVDRLVFVSSLAVYGRPQTDRINEGVAPEPRSAYGRTKVAAEEAVLAAGSAYLDRRILRPCGVYGPVRIGAGSHSARFIEALLAKAARSKEAVIEGSPNAMDQYVYVKDLGRAIALVALRDTASTEVVFNVGPGFASNADDLLSALTAAVPDVQIEIRMSADEGEPAMPPLDVSRIHRAYGFAPQYSLSEGLADYAREGGFVS